MCAVSSILFLSIGYACGWFGHKYKQSRTSKATSLSAEMNTCQNDDFQIQGPLYEQLQVNSIISEHQDHVELTENVAYGPIIAK